MLDVDLTKGYDTVEQWVAEASLRRMGTPMHFINMLTHMHRRHTIKTYAGYGATDGFHPQRGACPQGESTSCAVFLAVMDWGLEVTSKANLHKYKIDNTEFSQIAYCDDCTYIVQGTPDKLQQVTHSLGVFNHIASLHFH